MSRARNLASIASTSYFTVANDKIGIGITNPVGQFQVSSGPVIIGTATSTGTASQRLQVTGGAYVSGSVGIGTTSPGSELEIYKGSASDVVSTVKNTVGEAYACYLTGGGDVLTGLKTSGNYTIRINNTERARIDSSGRLLVGTSTFSGSGAGFEIEGTGNFGPQIIATAKGSDPYPVYQIYRKSRGSSIVENGDELASISAQGYDGSAYRTAAAITAFVDGAPGSSDMPGRLVFSTTADGASIPTERARITSGGYFKASNDGTYFSTTSTEHEFKQTGASNATIFNYATNASYVGTSYYAQVLRAANGSYYFFIGNSGNGSDNEFVLYGNGNGNCDGAWTGGGADYAEYFEWADGNPDEEDRRGISVVLDGDQIRPAEDGEDPIGVISGNPSMVGDAAWNKWSGKYLRDKFGTYILEDYEVEDEDGNMVIQQRRTLNPEYDPDVEYTSREERPEWDCVGLMGKLRILKGQPTGSRWIKMRDIDDTVEEWLVR